MTKKKEEETVTSSDVETLSKEGEQETPPVNEEVVQLRNQLKQFEENWKNEQRVSSKHLNKIGELEAKLEDKDFQRAMLALVAQQRGETEEEVETSVKANKPDLLKQVDDLVKQREFKRQQEDAQRVGEGYRKRVEALGLTPKDKTYRDIFRDVRDGLFDFADASLEELEKVKVVTQPKAEDKQKDIEEAARKMLEEKGLLKTDTGASLASGMNPEKAMQAYIAGNISAEKAKEYGAKFV